MGVSVPTIVMSVLRVGDLQGHCSRSMSSKVELQVKLTIVAVCRQDVVMSKGESFQVARASQFVVLKSQSRCSCMHKKKRSPLAMYFPAYLASAHPVDLAFRFILDAP
jgi:hypothetical protein